VKGTLDFDNWITSPYIGRQRRVAIEQTLSRARIDEWRNMNIPLGCLRTIFLVLTLSSAVVAASDGEVMCRQQLKTSNNCYRLYRPPGPARGLV
jgi:hypothetical protein